MQFENAVCEMAAILPRPQRVEPSYIYPAHMK